MFFLYFFLSVAVLSLFARRYIPEKHVGSIVYGLSFFAAFATGPIRAAVRNSPGGNETLAGLAGLAFMAVVILTTCILCYYIFGEQAKQIAVSKAHTRRLEVRGRLTSIEKDPEDGEYHFQLTGADETSYNGTINPYFSQSFVPADIIATLEERVAMDGAGGEAVPYYYLVSLTDCEDGEGQQDISS